MVHRSAMLRGHLKLLYTKKEMGPLKNLGCGRLTWLCSHFTRKFVYWSILNLSVFHMCERSLYTAWNCNTVQLFLRKIWLLKTLVWCSFANNLFAFHRETCRYTDSNETLFHGPIPQPRCKRRPSAGVPSQRYLKWIITRQYIHTFFASCPIIFSILIVSHIITILLFSTF